LIPVPAEIEKFRVDSICANGFGEGIHVAKRLLRREQIVAASLVGSVVVVVGFASGLGTRPGTGANAAPAPGGEENPVATAPPPPTTTQTQPRRNSTQPPRTGGGSTGGGVIPVTTMPTLPPGTSHTGHPPAPTTPPPTTTPPGTTPPPPTTCQPGLVPAAVTTLLGTLGRATDALGLGGLLGGAPTAALLPTTSLLPGEQLVLADGTLLSALPDGTLLLPDGTPLDQFIATCPEATTPAPTTPDNGHG
jgi:hypothetical protein